MMNSFYPFYILTNRLLPSENTQKYLAFFPKEKKLKINKFKHFTCIITIGGCLNNCHCYVMDVNLFKHSVVCF